jgi:hypothetical protein
VEVYHNLYTSKVKAEAMRRGYGNLNEEAVEAERQAAVVVDGALPLTEEETNAKAIEDEEKAWARIQEYRRVRMAIMRTAAAAAFLDESEEVKAQIAVETAQRNLDRAGDEDIDGVRTPEQFQKYVSV